MPPTSTPGNPSTGPRELKILTTAVSTASSSSSSSPPPPPPTPCPWLWRCHSCYTIYRLSVTRRCLDCDHTFCLGDAAAAGPTSPPQSKKRKRGGPCKAEFDYTGWKTRGAWRRTVLLNGRGIDQNHNQKQNQTATSSRNAKKGGTWGDEHNAAAATTSEPTTTFDAKREHLFLRKQHNCSLHCDFPSECHHALFRAAQAGRPILREALALDDDAARNHDGTSSSSSSSTTKNKNKKFGRGHSTVHENGGATRFPYSLPRVDEAAADDPVSPVSPDPPGALMREVIQVVSPVDDDDDDDDTLLLPPVSPGGTTRRRSLLVATDTPADFATTGAPLCFDDDEDDTYSDDDDDESTHETSHRHAKRSRRKIAQLTGQEFGPFVFDTASSSPPTSPPPPPSSGATSATAQKAALDLQAAYSESAWFGGTPAVKTTISAGDPSPRSPERAGTRDRMLALLGRRAVVGGGGGGEASDPTRSSSREADVDVRIDGVPAPREENHHPKQRVAGEEWDDWSDSSSSTSTSTTSSGGSGPDTDADGDVTMRDAASVPPAVDDDMDDEDESPVTPPRRQRSGGDGTDADLRALLRMRNAFMRGDMI